MKISRSAFLLTATAGLSAGKPQTAWGTLPEEYVKLILGIGVHDPSYVDAYYGPAVWRDAAVAAKPSLESLLAAISSLETRLFPTRPRGELERLRKHYFAAHLRAAATWIRHLQGKNLPFDEEAKMLYGVTPPPFPRAESDRYLAQVSELFPGEGSLQERVDSFQAECAIPKDKLAAVFEAAIQEARRRTSAHISLPATESFRTEYVRDKVWSAYNWYQGNSRSLIQVNIDFPLDPEWCLHLAAHEGYPGHHVYNTLLEDRLVRKRDWVDLSVYALYGPQSLVAEGSAEYGVDLAFPDSQRIAFLAEKLFPVAGLKSANALRLVRLRELLSRLNFARNEAARNYLDGKWTRPETQAYLAKTQLQAEAKANQNVKFIETNRGYVVNYNVGRDRVAQWVERGPNRWKRFETLLSSPRLAEAL